MRLVLRRGVLLLLLLLMVVAVRRARARTGVDCEVFKARFCTPEHCTRHPSVAAACCDCHAACCHAESRSVRPPPESCTDSSGTARQHGERWQDNPEHPCAWLSCDAGTIKVDLNITEACQSPPEGFDCEVSRPPGKCCFEYLCKRTESIEGGTDVDSTKRTESNEDGKDSLTESPRLHPSPCYDAEGQERPSGAQWTSRDGCIGYTCFNGELAEVPILCLEQPPFPSCAPVPAPGECCPQFVCPPTPNDCVDQSGQVREDGAVWVGADHCMILQCLSGAIADLPISCPARPADPGCRERTVPGLCCPRYDCPSDGRCTDADGVVRSDGSHWSSSDGCIHFNCMAGMVASGAVTCPALPIGGFCAEVPPGPGECCPTYRCDVPDGGGGGEGGTNGTAGGGGSGTGSDGGDATVCMDSSGQVRSDGEHWTTPDHCTRYTCYRGVVLGVSAVCLPSPPGAVCVPETVPGFCCPLHRCVAPPPGGGCLDADGVVRAAGTHWTSTDGCQQFTCDDGQVLGLTSLCVHVLLPDCAPQEVDGQCCPDYNCTSTSPRDCINPDGTIQPHETDVIDDNGCLVATCRDGELHEVIVDCPPPPPPGCEAVHVPGQCCPTVFCPAACTDSDGVPLAHNRSRTSEDGCIIYSCFDGELSVIVESCARPHMSHCRPVHTPGERCPSYQCTEIADCYEPSGLVRPHNSNWTSTDGCTTYNCNDGVISSTSVSCPSASDHSPACVPVYNPGQCCPEYDCPNYGARDCQESSPGFPTRPHNSSWTSPDFCTVYSCFDGAISSRTIQCATRPGADSDCVPQYSDGQCCPTFVCPNYAALDCTESNGVIRPHNSNWTSADSCTVYSCFNGVISSRVIRCSVPPDYTPDCVPVYTAGVCCPDFECLVIRPQDCTTPDGQAVPHNSSLVGAGGCIIYSCRDGVLAEAVTDCLPPPQSGCVPVFTPGRCCPEYDCPGAPQPGCVDASGQMQPDGSHWVTANNCTRYVCEGREVRGISFLCVPPPPSYGVCSERGEPGRCCPLYNCSSPPADGACLDQEGVLRPSGSHWTSPDGCQRFSCDGGQVLGLTSLCVHVLLPGCLPQTAVGECCPDYYCPPTEPTGRACTDLNGRTRPHNSNWTSPDGCVRHCTDGTITVIDVHCPQPPGPDCTAVQDDDRCCPIYYCPNVDQGCVDEGQQYQEGQTWLRQDDCSYRYRCDNGQVTKTELQCQPRPSPECLTVPIPGLCCPLFDCSGVTTTTSTPAPTTSTSTTTPVPTTAPTAGPGGCIDEGRQYPNGQTWLRQDDCSYRYRCDNGQVTKTELQCQPPPSPECLTVPIPGLCCPLHDCSGVTASTSTPTTTPTTTTAITSTEATTAPTTQTSVSTTESGGAACEDENGQVRPSGDFWSSADGCTNHACVDGVIFSVREPCPPPPEDPSCTELPGTCCPRYQCDGDAPQPEPGCTDARGELHPVNQLYLDDPINPASCLVCAAGQPPYSIPVLNVTTDCPRAPTGCTEHFLPNRCCPEIACSSGEPCIFEGVARAPGEEWTDDPPCASYVCVEGVSVQTNRTVCRPFPAAICTARHVPGQCCPVPDCPPKSCTVAGQEHEHDTTWPLDPLRPCTLLSCRDGEVLSEDVSGSCPPPPDSDGCTASAVPYRCCPAYDCIEATCQYNGTTYVEGQQWLDDPAFPCRRFNCTRSGVATVEDHSAGCQPRPDPSCTASRLPGACCKQWLCPHCDVGGVQHPHGTAWWEDEQRHCVQNICTSGRAAVLEQHADCQPVPEGCTPLYRGNECCHYQYTCPHCNYDPYGNPIRSSRHPVLRRRRRREVVRRARWARGTDGQR